MRTDAPKDFAGRLWRNLGVDISDCSVKAYFRWLLPCANDTAISMRPADCAPNDLNPTLIRYQTPEIQGFVEAYPDLRSLHLTLCPVYECNLLAKVEASSLRCVYTLNLDKRSVRVGVALSPLERKVAALSSFVNPLSRILPHPLPVKPPDSFQIAALRVVQSQPR